MSRVVNSTAAGGLPGGAGQSPIQQRAQRRGRLLLAAVAAATIALGTTAVLALTGQLQPGRLWGFDLTEIPSILAATDGNDDSTDNLTSRSVVPLEEVANGEGATVPGTGLSTPVPPPGNLNSASRGSTLLGSPDQPFPPVVPSGQVRAVETGNGLVLPVISGDDASWRVHTACEQIITISRTDAVPIGPAHVVLDAGHGGTEPGAVGPSGLTEKEINLDVVLRAKAKLERLGAKVVLTRAGDHNITTKSRGRIAEAVEPALFVSVHHNGGAPAGGDVPGTMAFTKAGSDLSARFGGLFYQALEPVLNKAAAERRAAYEAYVAELEAYEALVDAYDQSVAARDEALVTNGQLPSTTIPSSRDTGTPPTARQRQPKFTTTVPANASTTVPVPSTIAPPPPFTVKPVQPFSFAGSGNRGVRAWIRPDGLDYLSVLRNSGDVPTVLVEYLYLTNPAEEALLMDPEFLDAQAEALVTAIVDYFSTTKRGTGFVADQYDDQPIGGGGTPDGCVEPQLP